MRTFLYSLHWPWKPAPQGVLLLTDKTGAASMRTLILLALVAVLIFLALDSAEKPHYTLDGPIITNYNGWKVRLFATTFPAEEFVLGLMVAVLVLFPRHKSSPGEQCRAFSGHGAKHRVWGRPWGHAKEARTDDPPPAASEADVETLREINRMLDKMERRIESLETILLDRQPAANRTAEHD